MPSWLILAWVIFTIILMGLVLLFLLRNKYQLAASELEAQARSAELKSALDISQARAQTLERERSLAVGELNQLREKNFQLQTDFATVQALAAQKESSLKAEIDTLRAMKESLSKDFENLANRLFDTKQEQFSRTSQLQLQQLIQPFRDQLNDFRSKVENAQLQDAARHHQMLTQIVELQKQSEKIGMDAVSLANALKGNNKVMGSWGEMILANILEQMGFLRGRDFDLQISETNSDGRRLQPDVVVYLPDEKDLIIDAKVSLIAFERFNSQTEESLRTQAMKEHVDSIRAHLRNLGGKNYADFVGRKRLDFVCMFVPVEAAFVYAVQQAPELLQEAYDKQILMVSPASLFAILRTVNALWQRDRQDKNVEQIVVSAGKLHDQFVRFLESMQDVGTAIERAEKSFNTAMSRLESGKGNLIKRSDDLRRLGAKAGKVIPADLVERAQTSHDSLENQVDE
ncbi:MAG: DNA recombination protein RmuC [Cellvibrionaceae bacterium]|nr:DNA recombination protein RmuC [Cellvibrionaceae bacterium]